MHRITREVSFIICLVLILALAGCASTRTQESAGEYIDDAAITTKVKTALLADEDVSGTAIGVETFKGRVQLSGFVNSAEQARKAVRIAQNIEGVREVENKMTVK